MATAKRSIHGASPLPKLRASMEQVEYFFPHDVREIGTLAEQRLFCGYPTIMRKVFGYLSTLSTKSPKPNVEASFNAEFNRVHTSIMRATKKSADNRSKAQVSCLWPAGGIQDNTVNRLLLMSSSEQHLASVPMALFIKSNVPEQ